MWYKNLTSLAAIISVVTAGGPHDNRQASTNQPQAITVQPQEVTAQPQAITVQPEEITAQSQIHQQPNVFQRRQSHVGGRGHSQGQIQGQFQQGQTVQGERAARILRYQSENNGKEYRYAYETENGIRAEEAGSLQGTVLRVQGGYSYPGTDGQVYTVTYVADENGFRARGAHLPTPPPMSEAIARSIEQNARDEANGLFDDGKYVPEEQLRISPQRNQQQYQQPQIQQNQQLQVSQYQTQQYQVQQQPQQYQNQQEKSQLPQQTGIYVPDEQQQTTPQRNQQQYQQLQIQQNKQPQVSQYQTQQYQIQQQPQQLQIQQYQNQQEKSQLPQQGIYVPEEQPRTTPQRNPQQYQQSQIQQNKQPQVPQYQTQQNQLQQQQQQYQIQQYQMQQEKPELYLQYQPQQQVVQYQQYDDYLQNQQASLAAADYLLK